jgi:drug/metabolite transporter (DMT)-like permease
MYKDTKVAIVFAILCIVWGTTYLGIAEALKGGIAPFMMAAVRHIIAGFFFTIYCISRGYTLPTLQDIKKLSLVGILMIVGGNALVCWAEQFIPSGVTAVICSLSPVFITLMSAFAFQNFKITLPIVLGLCLSMSGIICISNKSMTMDWTMDLILAMVLLVIANLSWGLGSILMKKNKLDLYLFLIVGIQMLIGGTASLLLSFIFEPQFSFSQVTAHGWWAMTYLIVAGSLIGYGSYAYTLSHYLPSRVSIHTYINTVIAVFVGWLIGHEGLDTYIIGGTILVLVGVLVINRAYAKINVT